ncbi:hypothetical protein ACFX2G_034770 [Malus domestica]
MNDSYITSGDETQHGDLWHLKLYTRVAILISHKNCRKLEGYHHLPDLFVSEGGGSDGESVTVGVDVCDDGVLAITVVGVDVCDDGVLAITVFGVVDVCDDGVLAITVFGVDVCDDGVLAITVFGVDVCDDGVLAITMGTTSVVVLGNAIRSTERT